MTDDKEKPPINRLIFAIYSRLPKGSKIKEVVDDVVEETLEYDAEARKIYQDPGIPLPTATVMVGLGRRLWKRFRRDKDKPA